jgi:HAD superfamily hydrolase (TIGR01549 family)
MAGVAALLDVDGTLVDTNYHHALAWSRALRAHGCVVPLWQIHRHIGMGGDQFVAAVAGEDVEREHGDAIREEEGRQYGELIGEVAPLPHAVELLDALRERGHRIVLASSAKAQEVEHYIELLDARPRVIGATTSADVEATKPHPDLVHAALERAGGGPAVMVGDSTWDVEAARRAGVPTIAVRTGGFGADELRSAGAVAVFDSLDVLIEELDELLEQVVDVPVSAR